MGKVIPINPYNKNHIKLIKEFEQVQQLDSSISNYLNEISSSQTESEYQSAKKHSNIIEEYFILEEDSKAKGLCYLYGEKDRKYCKISFPFLFSKIKSTILLVTNYAMENLGMVEVLIDIDKSAKDIATYLEKNGYENLGEESSKIVYLKEKEVKAIEKGSYHESTK